MILTRMGNKRRLANKLAAHFPPHKMRIDLFFGAGGAFFKLPTPKYSILNDLDDDVTNLYKILLTAPQELYRAIEIMPIAESLMRHWYKHTETDPIKKALRFLLLSNFSYLGTGRTLRVGLDNAKETLLSNIYPTFEIIKNCKILNKDFRDVIPSISFTKGLNDRENCFVYLDPVYLDTEHNYRVPKWTKDDTVDCLEIMNNCGIRSAMSEFSHPTVVAEAKQRGLNIIPIGERSNIKSRSVEILITNFDHSQYKMF